MNAVTKMATKLEGESVIKIWGLISWRFSHLRLRMVADWDTGSPPQTTDTFPDLSWASSTLTLNQRWGTNTASKVLIKAYSELENL